MSGQSRLGLTGAGRFVGGMRTRFFNASWPLAQLVVTDGAVTVELRSRLLRRLFARTSRVIPFGELPIASRVRSPIPGPGGFGLSLESTAGAWVVFYAPRRTIDELVAVLQGRGVSIASNPQG